MPGTELEVATLDAETTDPLAEVLAQVGESEGAVMVLGLERAVRMTRDDAPVLRALNLERSEWPERLRRPVVFWVPEALVGALGRTAPDFLDWRSDTLYFPADSEGLRPVLAAFDASLWQGGGDQRMPEQARRARVDELRSRLQLTPRSDDPLVEKTRASWFFELGNHLLFLGAMGEAQKAYEESIAISDGLGDRSNLAAAYHQLGVVAEERGRSGEAVKWYRSSLRISEELGYISGIAVTYHQLGVVAQERGQYEEAGEWYRKSLEIFEKIGDRFRLAASYHQIGNVLYLQGAYEAALDWYRKSLAIEEELGNRFGMAGSYHQLGRVAQARGSYEEAEEWYRKSLAVSEQLGNPGKVGQSSSQIGVLLTEWGRVEEAVPWSLRALMLHRELAPVRRAATDLQFLRRQREALGDERFRELVEEHAGTPDLAAYVLKATAEPLGEPAQEVAEAPAEYGAGGRSEDGA
ncbi:MAG: tetratricopeptide repeat protein [Thermoanaerobaculia bacterium]